MDSIVITVALLLVAAGAAAVAATQDPTRQAVVASVWGLTHGMLLVVLRAPDVALAAVVVSSFLNPVVTLLALAKAAEWARDHERARNGSAKEAA